MNNSSARYAWDAEVIDRLKALRAEGKSANRIADILSREFRYNFTRNAVIGKARRIGLDGRPSSIKKGGGALRRSRKAAPSKPRAVRVRTITPVVSINPNIAAAVALPDGLFTLEQTQARDGCRWPYGDTPNMRFCGHEREAEKPYCSAHCVVAYTLPAKDRAA